MKKSIKTNIIAVCTLSVISLLSINVSALDYQKTINVGFNLQDTLTVSLSSPNLIIDDLMPGTASDSNIITVNVLSNNPYGYTLTSNVGNDTTYNTDKLIHASSATATPFSTITAGTTVTDLNSFTNYQWGYSYSTDDGASWITDGGDAGYSGLPLYGVGEATLLEKSSTSAAAGDNIQFKIAAKASDTQLAGEYKNIINFILTGAPEPVKTMQTVTASDLATLMPNVGDTTTLADARDDQEYTIAKLADNKYWMISNLNLAGGTALSADDTDFDSDYNPPVSTVIKDGDGIITLPSSSLTGFNNYAYPYVYNSGSTSCGYSKACYSYYSWIAATVGSGYNIRADNANAPYSICPKGWRLPSTYNGNSSSADFNSLVIAYGGSSSTQIYNYASSPTGAIMYQRIGPNSNANFIITAGYISRSNWDFSANYDGGNYWTSTAASSSASGPAYAFYFTNTYMNIAQSSSRYKQFGLSIRCVFRDT